MLSPLVETLYVAHKEKATGWMTVTALGRESQIVLKDGDVVGANVTLGFQGAAQALFQAGKVSAQQLDALWARGEAGRIRLDNLEELGASVEEAVTAQVLASVRRLFGLAENARFEARAVDSISASVAGVRVVRAAIEAGMPEATTQELFRCPDVAACETWLLSADERAFLETFGELNPASHATREQMALLRLLQREGLVEALSEETWKQRQAERLAEEARQTEEARRAEEQRLAEEARQLEEARRAEEEQLAEEARRAALQPVSGELPVIDLAASAPPDAIELQAEWIEPAAQPTPHPEPTAVTDTAQLSERLAEQEPLSQTEETSWGDLLPADAVTVAAEPGPQAPVVPDETAAMGEARRKAQDDLVREMNEALRRAGAGSDDAWLDEESPVQAAATPGSLTPTLEVPALSPDVHTAVTTEVPVVTQEVAIPEWGTARQPLIFGPSSQAAAGEDDLWRIVDDSQQTPAPAQGQSSSFEEALQRVDANLEALVGTAPADSSAIEPPVEATVEAIIEPVPNGGGNVAGGPQGEEDLAWDENDVADPSDPESAKKRRQRLLRRAMENLGAMGGGRPAPTPEANVRVIPESPTPAAPSVPTKSSAEDQQLSAQIERRFKEITEKKDHFTLLGLPREASREDVKTAFLGLAKIFHPDRLPPSLSHLSAKMTTVFEGIREAYDTLYDDARRAAYLRTLAQPPVAAGRSGQRAEEAAELFKKGEVFFKKRDYPSAEEHYRRAHSLDPKAEYLAAQGWAVYMNPARKADAPQAKQQLLDALKADNNCDRAHYQLGVIYRVEGDVDRAERHFREAVRANPRHLEANQELRLIEMRKKKEKKGFFR
ncbi:MAG: tetratricopeptide repeat protein [Myxococcota bacterium]